MIEAELWGRSPTPLGDPAFTADGRLVVSHHPAFKTDVRVSVFTAPDRLEPYPDVAWNKGGGGEQAFDSVQGLRTDREGVLWMTDLGSRHDVTPKIVGWDTRAGRHHRVRAGALPLGTSPRARLSPSPAAAQPTCAADAGGLRRARD